MGTNPEEGIVLSPLEKDAIGEVMNISMGSAATAVSQMLDRQVEITTPVVEIQRLSEIRYEHYEPALLVKIVYTTGITGSNVMVFRQHDMQMILNTLMGIPDPPSDDFVFDELSISAACEVMNQMMGSSATALAEFLGKTIDISTPTATVMENENTFREAMELPADAMVAAITFKLTIKDMLESEFVSVLTTDLAKEIISPFISGGEVVTPQAETPPPPAAPEPAPAAAAPAAPAAQAPPPAPGQAPYPQQPYPDPYAGQAPQAAYPPPQQPMYYPPQQPYAYAPPGPSVEVRPVEFPEFPQGGYLEGTPVMGNNMDLIMNVPLDVSIEIGTTKRKIRDIMNFTSGTVVELDKQAGAPIDIVVNGQLIAHGDVVVIDDNFGVRITEIVGTKELLNSLNGQADG
ncbi:flagellar motor switch phosphatase FliY [Ruminococcaceae bacterium OttesenSCG-928-A11]|nr:flagellar motor switch phosphatase FliY [Ruminococcaceae bacterium OttesenSCG-928-A11]